MKVVKERKPAAEAQETKAGEDLAPHYANRIAILALSWLSLAVSPVAAAISSWASSPSNSVESAAGAGGSEGAGGGTAPSTTVFKMSECRLPAAGLHSGFPRR